jgi:AcrR family transcriptional regulator
MSDKDIKTKILEAAENEFADRGFDSASVNEIARKAKVNKAMLYYYFGNKEELYVAVIKNIHITKQKELIKILDTENDNFVRMVERIVESHFDLFSERPNILKIMSRQMISGKHNKQMSSLINKVTKPTAKKMFEAINKGVKKGELMDLDPLIVMHMLMSIIFTFFLSRSFIEEMVAEKAKPDFINKYKGTIINMFLYGIMKDRSGAPTK